MHTKHRYRDSQSIDETFYELKKAFEGDFDEGFINELYQRLIPEIRSIARRYLKLDRTLELDDFLDEGYLAVRDALLKYVEERGKGNFSTYAYWYFQKRFENLCCKDKVVVVKDDENVSVISYKEFQKIKRDLKKKMDESPDRVIEWTVQSRLIPFEPFYGTNGNPDGIRGCNNETEYELLGLLEEWDEVTCFSMSDRDGGDFKS